MRKITFIVIASICAVMIPIYFFTGDTDDENSRKVPASKNIKQSEQPSLQEDGQMPFKELVGTVTKIEQLANHLQQFRISKPDNEYDIIISKDTLILTNTGEQIELKEGQNFTAFVNINKPMITIYPPQYSPEIIIIQTDSKGMVVQGKFNRDFVNDELSLKLNIDEETVMMDLQGNTVSSNEIVNQNILVFYDKTTRSIPAQTSPTKIILLNEFVP